MKKLFYIFICIIALLSCSPKIVTTDDGKGDIMMNAMNGVYSTAQFDSMCIADTLPKELAKWQSFGARDYETSKVIVLYLYMKSWGTNEVMYKVEALDNDSMKIIKRGII